MLKWGNERVDEGKGIYRLQATAIAHRLYIEMGWKKVKMLHVDLSDWVVGGKVEGQGGEYTD